MQPQQQMSHQEQVAQFMTQEVMKELETQRNLAHSRSAQLAAEIANAKVAISMANQQIEKLTAEVKRLQEENAKLKPAEEASAAIGKPADPAAPYVPPVGTMPEELSPQPGASGGLD